MFNRLKQFRRIATRYDKTRKSFSAFLALAAAKIWLPYFVNGPSAVREHTVADGHAVDWAKDLAEARHCASVVSDELILLDIHLPDGCGVGYLREMSKRADSLPVIVLTAREQISDRIEALNAGADDYW